MSQTNPFAFRGKITEDTIDELLAHHRSIFGGLHMEAENEGGDGGTEGGEGGTEGGTSFTAPASQEELDRIIENRLSRERAKYADYDEIKRKAAERDAELEASKTEAEKAVDAARQEGEKAALERTNSRLVNAEVRARAAAAKFHDPKDAAAHLDLSKIAVGDDGEVDGAAVDEALKSLATSKPYLIDDGKKPAPKPDRTQGGGGGTDTPSVSRGREMFADRKARKGKTS